MIRGFWLILIPILIAVAVVAGWYVYTRPAPAGPQLEPVQTTEVSFTTLAEGQQSQVSSRTNYLIHTDAQLRDLWKLLNREDSPSPVDFDQNTVAAVFMGERPTAGHSIAVTKVEDDGERTVFVALSAPGASCISAQVITAPYQVIALPKTSLAYAHEDSATTAGCLP